MSSPTKDFYESGCGDYLIDFSFFPEEVKDFLLKEELLLSPIEDSFRLLIEVGCMHGRYLGWAVERGKSYIGIDVVHRFIEEGRRRIAEMQLPVSYQFVEGAAEDIPTLIPVRRLRNKKCLLFFPFNSFGNMEDAEPVIAAVKASGLSFLISSYQTTATANACREEYYRRCGYRNIRRTVNDKGVCFYSDDGLRTVAYHPAYIRRICIKQNVAVRSMPFSFFGIAYFSEDMKGGGQL